jgi:hypothetical protein
LSLARFPLNEAAAANALLEGGTVIGNLVLLPERLRGPSTRSADLLR